MDNVPRNQKGNDGLRMYVCMAQVTEGACQKGEEGVDTHLSRR